MEKRTTNYNFPKRLIAAFGFVMVTAHFLVACSNGGGGGNNNVVPVTPCSYGCQQGVVVSGQTLITAPSSSPLQGEWTLSGDANIIGQMRAMYPMSNIHNIYQGPLFISGTIVAGNLAAFSGTCVPLQSMNGSGFSFTTVQAGQAAYGMFEVPQVQASSGLGTFTFEVHRGMLYNGRFSATLLVTSVNGTQCRSFPIAVY